MNIEIVQIKCNACGAIIPARGKNGAINLAGTQIDFCSVCAGYTVSAASATFKMPAAPPPPAGFKTIQMANGTKMNIPSAAPVPAGATVIS